MQDRPTAQELLAAVADLLEDSVLGATSGPLQHQVRVAGNLCRILEREMAQQSDRDERAAARLAEILGSNGSGLEALNRELATRLRSHPDPELERRAWPVLVEIVRGKLAINKPGHDGYDFAPEIEGGTSR